MQEKKEINNQLLAMYADGQLDAANSEAVIDAMDNDPVLRERYYRLRRNKELVQMGYGYLRAPSSNRKESRLSVWSQNTARVAAAAAAIAVIFGAGGLSQHYLNAHTANPALPSLAAATVETPEQIILHISESDPMDFIKALEYAKNFLEVHEAKGGRIEVVANAGGIDLLRSDISPVAEEIIDIIRDHDNVQFVACANAIRMLRRKGIEPAFIEGTHADESVMDYVIRRIQEGGWTYVKVDSLAET